MDWLLAALAIFNLVSMITVFTPRIVPRRAVPWVVFFFALAATELSWIWLPLQVFIAGLLSLGGALDSALGIISALVLLATWPGLVWSILKSRQAGPAVERALQAGLGTAYREQIPPEARARLRSRVRFEDWKNPWKMSSPEVEVIRHVPYGPGGVRQEMDIYRPAFIPEGGCPVLLQIHGGAWVVGDKGSQALPLMTMLAKKGWICVAANYRLSPSVGFPTHLEDCKAALCWIREHGRGYGMNPEFVAVTGGSAGGHLTALMGLTENRRELQPTNPDGDTSVQACIPFYGVYDFLVRYNQHPNQRVYERFVSNKVIHETREENPELWDLASPVAQVHADAPPFMLVHGDRDSLAVVTEGRVFSEKLREVSNNPVVYAELPGAEHAFEIVHSLRTEETIDGVHRFLEWARARHAGAGAEPQPGAAEQAEPTEEAALES